MGPTEAKPGTYTAAFSEAMIKEAEARPELVAITAAMPDSTGLLPFGERFPGRLIDVGIAEQHAVTSAAGMAMGGLRPVVALYATFLTRAIDQVVYDVGLHGQPVVFCLDRAGITGDDGPSHHGVLGSMIADALARRDGPAPRVRVLGTPTEFIHHAKPDQILADLGLDAAGLAREARALVTALRA